MFHVELDRAAAAIAQNPPPVAESVFGPQLPFAQQYCEALASAGVERGLIGPHERERLWERHIMNCAVISELVPQSARVVDIGSGAGLPGIPLALARPDLDMTLLEPHLRRVQFLTEFLTATGLPISVLRGRAEEPRVRAELGAVDVVVSRALASLAVLAGWSLPLLREHGRILAIKGVSAPEELTRDHAAVTRAGGSSIQIVECGRELVSPATMVVSIERVAAGPRARRSRPRGRRGRR